MTHEADKRFRVTRRGEISHLFQVGWRASDELITLHAVRNDSKPSRCRAAVAVSKRHGSAVKRNRVKRLCREAFRLVRHVLPAGWDFLIVPRPAAGLALRDLQASLIRLAGRLAEKAAQEGRRQ